MPKSRTAGYRKYVKRDTIPVINIVNKKGIPMWVDGGMFTYYGEGVWPSWRSGESEEAGKVQGNVTVKHVIHGG